MELTVEQYRDKINKDRLRSNKAVIDLQYYFQSLFIFI